MKYMEPIGKAENKHGREQGYYFRSSVMECGFRIVYGYTESDEISLLFHPD